jgi:Lipase (class 3)
VRVRATILGRPCSVHRGFDDSYDALEKPVVMALVETCRGTSLPKPLFITGHSKGAAVAKRCALSLLERNIPVHAVITFGEPRGGDSRYAAIYRDVLGQRTLRVTNAADPVPWLPAWLAGNRHCGPEAWLPPDPNPQPPTINHQLIIGPRLWWKLAQNFREIYHAWQLQQLTPLNDHHINNYLHRLNAL